MLHKLREEITAAGYSVDIFSEYEPEYWAAAYRKKPRLGTKGILGRRASTIRRSLERGSRRLVGIGAN
jgi:hypothetical protein